MTSCEEFTQKPEFEEARTRSKHAGRHDAPFRYMTSPSLRTFFFDFIAHYHFGTPAFELLTFDMMLSPCKSKSLISSVPYN